MPTGQLNRAVSRNLSRFPPDFMFQLTREELNNLMYQNGTSSWAAPVNFPMFSRNKALPCSPGC
ncbi:ORF6N domain-containing protein [Mucilaginibacter pedocola]|uniref:ORF6N domain-containing protein n=1 Tax=Mucilaginibacter pedocola TaxID=1792845 RepID=UPI001EE40D0C|nr:ORF6N domain-containing protein [Mucilaginibacter pedocola]